MRKNTSVRTRCTRPARLEDIMAKVIVTEECIGCESCVEVCPAVFVMDETTGHATVTDPDSTDSCVEEAIEICPVQAIVRE